ncbi:ABC transporter substrate-binding protein [Marinobacter sp. JSM 1782161]|uniref:ABC transporter substrate-binding protein n=1 Tax=Marinobacter sp. JSM 1782161 TaxID=2685906 RepID=UPI0014034E2F|nr:ABC transporter substrate-binding protein [Marinobacter sp. JSM 1782161]
MLFRVLPGLLCLLFATQASAATFRVGLLHGDARIFDYELSVIRLALAHAPGQHELEVVPMPGVPQNRIFAILNQTPGPINLFFSGYSPEREQRLRQVDIPMTRGLLGVRLFAVDNARLDELSGIHSLDDLRQWRIGSGTGWPENTIMRQNGLDLKTSSYDNLWEMLNYERFDLFHRGIQEIFTELARPGRENLAVLPGVALAFRYDYFLYVARDRTDLHDILLQGLQTAYRNGAFMDHFLSHPQIRTALDQSRLQNRRLIRLALPESSALGRIPARYWYTPNGRTASNP